MLRLASGASATRDIFIGSFETTVARKSYTVFRTDAGVGSSAVHLILPFTSNNRRPVRCILKDRRAAAASRWDIGCRPLIFYSTELFAQTYVARTLVIDTGTRYYGVACMRILSVYHRFLIHDQNLNIVFIFSITLYFSSFWVDCAINNKNAVAHI